MRLPGPDDATAALPQPRRRNPDRTRASILNAATAEFATRGYDGASVNEIAHAAGVNKRMLYHYFDSKEGLYLACLEAVYRRLAQMIAALGLERRAPDDALEAFVIGMFEHVLEDPSLIRLAEVENMAGGRFAAGSSLLPGLLVDALGDLGDALARGEAAGLFRRTDPLQLWMTLVAIAWFPVSNQHTVGLLLGRDPMTLDALEDRRSHLVDVARAVVMRPARHGAAALHA